MGFFLWAALTIFALVAGLALVLRAGRSLRLAEQLVAAVIVAVALVASSAQILGYTSVLYGWSFGGLVGISSAILISVCRPPQEAWADLASRVRRAARAVVSPGSLVVIVPA